MEGHIMPEEGNGDKQIVRFSFTWRILWIFMQTLNTESSTLNNSQGSVDRQRYMDLENFPKENHVV